MLEWLWPWVFAAAPLPLIVHRLSRGESLQPSALRAPFASRWRGLSGAGQSVRSGRGYWWLLWLTWMMLIVATARPQWIGEPIELPNTGRDLMLGLDLSGSMQIEDMQIGNRLVPRITAVKAIAADFTERRQGDRVGLILFGTRAYLQAPLTFDLSTVTRFIDEAQLGFAGEDTAIGDALGLAIKRLRERPASSRVFILLTDGQDTASTVDPMEAAALAAQLSVKIYTIGISRNLGRTSNGRNEVDEAMLNAVAEATGGRYFRATSPAELEAVYALLDELEPVEQEASTFRPKRALSWIPLLIALGLASLLALFRSRWLKHLGYRAQLWVTLMIDGFHLLRPELLWGLALCPLVALALWYRRIHQGDWTRVIDPELLPHLLPERRGQTKPAGVWAPTLLLSLVTLAAAGPSLQQVELPVIKRADALVIVLDLSASMLAADVQPSRAQRAQQKILDLLDTRDEGVTGLVVFAGDAHVVTPLTDDTRTIANLMPALSPAIMPLPGADATSGIELASDLLRAAGAQGGQVLLMTDGLPGFDTGAARRALDESDAALAILAIGTVAGAPIPLASGGFLKDNSGEIVIPTLERTQISAVAAALDAPYQEVSLDERDIETLTQRDLLATEGELDLDRQTDAWQDQGYWLAALVALLVLPAFRKGVVATLALMLVAYSPPPKAAEWQDLWLTSDQQGARHLAAGDASEAANTFTHPDWRGVAEYEAGSYDRAAQSFASENTADNFYNLGNALALQGDLQGAINAYEESLALQPDSDDAVSNRDFIQSLLDQQEQQQNQEGDPSEENNESESEGDSSSESSDQGEQQPDSDSDSEQNQDEENEQQGDNAQEGQQHPSMADAQEKNSEALEAATQEQMAKFDEALEEQQALEQWLRRVPDDPGGLLRRKFRYQTMQRLREGEEPDESIRW